MNGAVFLGGGGSPDDERDVWRWAYTDVERVLYWPFALSGEILATADAWFRGALASLHLAPEVVTWTDLAIRDGRELADFDLLHVCGGNTFRLLSHIRRHSFLDPVRDFVRDGGTYYGGSAGAIVACRDIDIAAPHDPNDVGLVDLNALALIPSLSVLPHYDGTVEPPLTWARTRNQAVLAVPDRGGIRYHDGTFTAIGPDPSAEITVDGAAQRPAGTTWAHHTQ